MANTEKWNFRYPGDQWRAAVRKTVKMRRLGYSVNMTALLAAEIDRFLAEDIETSAFRLRLEKRVTR